MIDAHAHLCDEAFAEDLPEVLERARASGVCAVVAVGENLKDGRRNLRLADAYPMVLPAVGLYPTNLSLDEAAAMVSFIREHHKRLAAVGEVGLDRWAVKEEAGREIQAEIFSKMIDAAREVDLPLNVHSRAAGRRAVAQLLGAGAKRVQLHAFDGKASAALPAVEAGYYFSIPPSIVRSRQKQKLVKALPLSSLLLESDSPVLGPDPGMRNEPANIARAVDAVAQIKGASLERVLKTALENTARLYGDAVLWTQSESPI